MVWERLVAGMCGSMLVMRGEGGDILAGRGEDDGDGVEWLF
jgi:hypothetical protein